MPRRHRQRNPTAHADRVNEPVKVFVSSHQKEFARVRKLLQLRIEGLGFEKIGKWLFGAELAEDQHDTRLKESIERLLAQSSIYVVIIGRRNSKWVKYEYDYASSYGIPTLAYEYYRKGVSPRPVRTKQFVKKLFRQGIKVRGHHPKFKDVQELIDSVINDLPELLGKIVNTYANMKRAVSKV